MRPHGFGRTSASDPRWTAGSSMSGSDCWTPQGGRARRCWWRCFSRGLRERSWHALRHTFATHAARFGVNPWRLQAWLGHSTITMTMRYVHHVEEHHRPVPATILAAGATIMDPDARVMAMLGARSGLV